MGRRAKPQGNALAQPPADVELRVAQIDVARRIGPAENIGLGVGGAEKGQDDLSAVGVTSQDQIGPVRGGGLEDVRVVGEQEQRRAVVHICQGRGQIGMALLQIVHSGQKKVAIRNSYEFSMDELTYVSASY